MTKRKDRSHYPYEPKTGTDEWCWRQMVAHAGQEWAMTTSSKGWHGYAVVGQAVFVWFDPDGVCLGIQEHP